MCRAAKAQPRRCRLLTSSHASPTHTTTHASTRAGTASHADRAECYARRYAHQRSIARCASGQYVLEQRRMDRATSSTKPKTNCVAIRTRSSIGLGSRQPAMADRGRQADATTRSEHVACSEHMKAACQDGLSVLGVTSASHGEGRTTVACCLARLGRRAWSECGAGRYRFGSSDPVRTNEHGVEYDWRDCLSEDVSLEEVAVHSIDDQLTVLPLKPRGGRPGLLASDSRIADILADLSDSFELVIVDCSKTSSSGNVITGLAHTKIFDAAIVVVDRRDSEADRVEDAVRMIQQTGIESIGIVDNFRCNLRSWNRSCTLSIGS